MSFISQHLQQPVGQMPTQIRFQIQDRVRLMTRQGGMKQAARDWLNRTDATGNGILNGKNESDVRTGLTSVCQLLYFPISCFFISPYWCTLSPNSPIEKKEISNDRTRPMKADQKVFLRQPSAPITSTLSFQSSMPDLQHIPSRSGSRGKASRLPFEGRMARGIRRGIPFGAVCTY